MSEHFTEEELSCKCGCGTKASPHFVTQLEFARRMYGRSMIVSGRIRCRAEQQRVNPEVEISDHEGYGLDIRWGHLSGREKYEMDDAFRAAGFTRLGYYDKHIHIGNHPELPERVLWVGKSK